MLTVVVFLWTVPHTTPKFTWRNVRAVKAMFEKHCPVPHRFVCVTDNREGLSGVECIDIDMTLRLYQRYAKLTLFRPDADILFGSDRLLGIDLDVLLVGDMTPIVTRTEDCVLWRDPLLARGGAHERHYRYNSSLILLKAGARRRVWDEFNVTTAPKVVSKSQLIGSDQAYIGAVLGPNEATFTQADGVLAFRHDLKCPEGWPPQSRVLVFHGQPKPWALKPDHPMRLKYEDHLPR